MMRVRAAASGAVVVLGAAWLACFALPDYWLFLLTSGIIAAIALQSVGIVSGQCGVTALCQMSFAGVGAWSVAWLNARHADGGLLLGVLVGGLAAVPVGAGVGALSLRLRGAHLAIATLGVATLCDSVFTAVPFPGQLTLAAIARPSALDSERSYFLFAALTCAALAVAIRVVMGTRVGLLWLMLKRSERAVAALGYRTVWVRLSAFAISAFVAGVAGGLMAGQLGSVVPASFGLMASLTLFTAGTMVGAHGISGAVVGGIVSALLPDALPRIDLPQDVGPMVFACGAIWAMAANARRKARRVNVSSTIAPGSFADQPRRRSIPRGHLSRRSVTPNTSIPSAALEVEQLGVIVNSLVVLSATSFALTAGTVTGLTGTNGSGKSTLVDAISGFLPGYSGRCILGGKPMESWSASRRARLGVRRTWQQPRVPTELSVADFLCLSAHRRLSPQEFSKCLEWLGTGSPDERVWTLTPGQQRRLESIGAAMARPRVLMLDEPTVGQSWEDVCRISDLIEWSAHQGVAVLLIEHNKESLSQVCDSVISLSGGHVTITCSPSPRPPFRKPFRGLAVARA